METYTFRVKVETRESKQKKGQKFHVFKAREKSGNWVRMKCRQSVDNVPGDGTFDVTVLKGNMNMSTDDFGEVLWVSQVESWDEPEYEDTVGDRF